MFAASTETGGSPRRLPLAQAGAKPEHTLPRMSELYLESAPAFTAGVVDLPRNVRLKNQLVMLERKTTRVGGRDSVSHPAGMHDDCSNVAAGVIVETLRANGMGSCFGLAELQGKGEILQVLLPPDEEKPKAVITTWENPPLQSMKAPPRIPPPKTWDLSQYCPACSGALEVIAEHGAIADARCSVCNYHPLQVRAVSPFAARSVAQRQNRGAYLQKQEKQPLQFGNGRRPYWGRFGG